MSIFKKSIRHSKSSKDFDIKIKNLDEDLKKMGVTFTEGDALSLSEKKTEEQKYDWRKNLYEQNNLNLEQDVLEEEIDLIRENLDKKNKSIWGDLDRFSSNIGLDRGGKP